VAIISATHEIKPTRITACKRTYVVANGHAECDGATATAAVNAAKTEARNQRALAEIDARALNCATARGCTCVASQRPTVQGAGLDWSAPRKVRGVWVAKAWAYTSFYIWCQCSS
jgi:hypothetical protein